MKTLIEIDLTRLVALKVATLATSILDHKCTCHPWSILNRQVNYLYLVNWYVCIVIYLLHNNIYAGTRGTYS